MQLGKNISLIFLGPLMFGGNSSLRRNRLLSASPYENAASQRFSNRLTNRGGIDSKMGVSNAPTPSSSKSTTPTSEDGMSSTARLILDTLERMSTPIRDAQKIPLKVPIVGRAEKRRQVMSELESSLVQSHCSNGTPSSKRRRPNLGNIGIGSSLSHNRTLLNGPPLRNLMSPVTVSTTTRSRPVAVTSARISTASHIPSVFKSSPSSNANSAVSRTLEAPSRIQSEKVYSQASVEKNKYQIPFSVPALSGGTLSSSVASVKPSTVTTFLTDISKSGKIRTKLGDKSNVLEQQQSEPLPPHLLDPTSGLQLKQLPNFGLDFLESNKSFSTSGPQLLHSNSSSNSSSGGGALSKSSSKTADTVLLSPVRSSSSSTFSFSDPVSILQSSSINPLSSSNVNGQISFQRFTFSQPDEVTKTSNNHSTSTNHYVMPDLTTSTNGANLSLLKNRVAPVQSLKTGSVMDILGGNEVLVNF
jgi:hypothetical protein